MNPLLRDFCGHQAWADAEHWRALQAHPVAAEDPAIGSRLHHIHMVQRVFMWAVGDRSAAFAVTKPEEFASLAESKRHARGSHEQVDRFLEQVSDARLDERSATRLRELGGEPPPIDLIVWYWKGRPAPAWT